MAPVVRFTCSACDSRFTMPLADVDRADEVSCPACGTEVDLDGDEERNPDDE